MNIPQSYRKVIESIKRKAKRKNVILRFGLGPTVHYSESDTEGCAGYYIIHEKYHELAVATKHPVEKWIQILLHESCHMDQTFDKRLIKQNKIEEWNNAARMYFEWLAGDRQLNKTQVLKYARLIMECEIDCDTRVVAKIRKYNLPIPIGTYVQKSNAYAYGYIVMSETRKWYNDLYNREEVWEAASKSPMHHLNPIPLKLREAMESEIKKTA